MDNERTFKEKFDDWKIRTQFRLRGDIYRARDFVRDNKEAVVGIAVVAVPGALAIGNSLVRKSIVTKEDRRRLCDIWDPKRGQHIYIKKPMKPNQQIEYARRYDNGETGIEILRSMGLV